MDGRETLSAPAAPAAPAHVRRWLLAITALAALLRFATLDRQSFWLDELVTGWLLRQDFTAMLDAVPSNERTPYLYYVLAWGWSHVFGSGEVGLRSLSALVGTATVPVAYAAATSLVTRRAGLIAAALVACNPFLVWYSQEARSYALVSFTTALSLLFFAHALERRPRALLWWALASSLAVATHYFAVFVIAAEAAWLLARPGRRAASALAAAVPAVVGLAHAGLAAHQAGEGQGLSPEGLPTRVVGLVKDAIVGYSFPAELPGTLAAAALVAAGVALLVVRTSRHERAGAVVALTVAAAAVLVPVVIALVGPDYVIARNAIIAVVPALVGLAGGYAASRAGLLAAAALCSLSVAVVLAIAFDPAYGRTDWRGAARALQGSSDGRAVVVTPSMSPALWRPYLPGLVEVDEGVTAREIVVVGLASEGGFGRGAVRPPAPEARTPPAGFTVLEAVRRPTFSFVRYGSRRPRHVTRGELARLRLTDAHGRVLRLAPAGT